MHSGLLCIVFWISPCNLIGPHFEKKKTEIPTLTFSALTTGLDSRIKMPPSLIQDLLFNWLDQNCIPHTHCLSSAWKIVPRLPDNCSEYPFQAADCQNFLGEHPHTPPPNIMLITVSWSSSKLFLGSYYRPRSEGDNALGSVRPSVC